VVELAVPVGLMLARVPKVGVPDSDEYAPVVATVAKPEVISLAVCVWARGVRASDKRVSLPFTTSPAAALPAAATLSAAEVPRVGVPERDE
jgi:hypothetical protein